MNKENHHYIMRLYIAGKNATAQRAIDRLDKIRDEYLSSDCSLDVIDLLDNPEMAAEDQIFAVPTLVRLQPLPIRKIIGDLSNIDKVLSGLDIKPPSGFIKNT